MGSSKKRRLSYRLDLLPVILPYHRRAKNTLRTGDLVYYGPSPEYYGIGEVVQTAEKVCMVDFRGTGELGIHKDEMLSTYLIPIHKLNLSGVLKGR
ncbi:MAG: hypothetical protein JJ953_01105 [Gracilimonas sp.]|uniref:DUF3553 domain-containing protein n=1 Tax=Gracilimonas sediminicola TaxID=2952158 RepID=A0A9X2L2P2_9BACT|nr:MULTISPECIES: hypothetical protein [Gracilimonas]MBO6584680.1 hypothetical protein [Gracilimonas sp.]MBO6616049.1 hypothetical protein [Gracilimonas sp.]MCP9291127.1 hypothetical protein [Gracilimonas sediminicola]